MSDKKSVRTLEFMKNFIPLRKNGIPIAEIAARHHISTWCAYNHLGYIAEIHNVTRDSLLYSPRHRQNPCKFHESKPALPLSEDYLVSLKKTLKDIDAIIGKINNYLAQEEKEEKNYE